MRCCAALALLTATCMPSLAGQIPLVGEPFVPGNTPIEWHATNAHKALWIYRVIPQNFSSAVVSNAMVAGSFRTLDLVKTGDKKLIRFQDHKRDEVVTRHLEIAPAAGHITYNDSADPPEVAASTQGVPTPVEAERLGLDLLFRLGIDRTQLASGPRPTGSMGISKVAATGEEQFIGIQARHICFIRQIDGISFTGNGLSGGFWVDFGSSGRIRQYELVWRNVVPQELRATASDAQVLAFVRQGQAVHSPDVVVRTAKKFTIKSLAPKYLGAPGDQPQDLIYPIASMVVEAELLTNNLDFELTCPIFPQKSISTK
jgi:hypothetical protein